MEIKVSSVTDFITAIHRKDHETDYYSMEIKTGSITDSIQPFIVKA